MGASYAAAWLSLASIPLSATVGWLSKRCGSGAFSIRMRPHFALGYIALVAALLHLFLTMPITSGANHYGIWFASLATAGLALQAFVGTNLQSPGIYRRPLRRWHIALFCLVALLAAGHVALNAPFSLGAGFDMSSTQSSTTRSSPKRD